MLGENVKNIIKQKGMTIYDVAEKIGTTNQNLYRILQKNSIDSKYLVQIATVLKVPIGLFFGEVQAKTDYYTFYISLNMIIEKIFEAVEDNNLENINNTLSDLKPIIESIDNDVKRIRKESLESASNLKI